MFFPSHNSPGRRAARHKDCLAGKNTRTLTKLRQRIRRRFLRASAYLTHMEKKRGEWGGGQPFASEGGTRVIVTPVSGGAKVLSERLAGPSGIPSA